jgi:hypothetical protein
MRERWMAMPPAARQNFQRNAERWLRMSPAERNVMRQRENLRRETIRRETDAAVRDSGLHLNPQERAQFESRYIQERQKVERTLRQQIEAERQQQLPELIRQLKKEFQIDQPTKGPVTKSVESPNPKKLRVVLYFLFERLLQRDWLDIALEPARSGFLDTTSAYYRR